LIDINPVEREMSTVDVTIAESVVDLLQIQIPQKLIDMYREKNRRLR
jgi:hypothetical protein